MAIDVNRSPENFFAPEKPVVKLQSLVLETEHLTCFNVRKTKSIAKFDDLEP